GEKCMDASSRWCLIDFPTGKIQPSKVIEGQDYSTYNTTRAVDVSNWKIPTFALEEGELGFSMTVRNSEYDHNMHVNNTRYADYCFNCFTVDELKERRLTSFSISYVRQCRENDVLRFFKKCVGDEQYLIQGVNEENQIVVQCSVGFVKR
ncbi:MAG: hypothetical protein IKC37_00795, partial [Clostridia bacterium]|nr:hypothetical protein [Clostridia bacterium]